MDEFLDLVNLMAVIDSCYDLHEENYVRHLYLMAKKIQEFYMKENVNNGTEA